MSALDQAFIKAYAKDIPAAAPNARPATAVATPPSRLPAAPPAANAVGGTPIEQLYRDGTLYRVEAPVASSPRRSAAPAPHFRLPPRSSPSRSVRRSMQRLFEQSSEQSPIPTARHPASSSPPTSRQTPRVELPPETIPGEPLHAEPLPVKVAPAFAPTLPPLPVNPRPEVAPLNVAEQLGPKVDLVHAPWSAADLAAQPAALVVLPEPADLHLIEPAPLVELRLDGWQGINSLPPPSHEPEYRLDAAHAAGPRRPHLKFVPPPVTEEEEEVAPDSPAPIIEQIENHLAEAERAAEALAADDLTFAELDPHAADATIAAAATTCAELPPAGEHLAQVPAKACIPVWEVDRFQWPPTVERLLTDKDGYFAQASGRLLAAVRDGLKMLAITGSRRNEGRTTLALCLARTAARAGIQVAVIDADFARPQLASKIGLEVTYGWQEAALGKVPLSETAVKSLADNITVLPLEVSAAGADLSLADPRVSATLRAAIATFELVILDLGPLAGSDADLFPAGEACPLDAAIVVRDLRYASLAESQSVGERLYAAGVEAVGIAENFVVEETAAV